MSKISAKHILVEREFEMNDVIRKLEEGVAFEEVARDFSICSSAENGGNLGEFGRGQMVRPFEKVAFALEPGELSKPVKTQFGFHIILRVD